MTDQDVERNLDRAFELAREVIEDPEAFPDEFVTLPLDEELVLHVLTRERLHLLRTVRDSGPFDSITQLADTVDRDPSRVGRDLTWLVEAGLIRLVQHGRAKQVQGTGRKILLT